MYVCEAAFNFVWIWIVQLKRGQYPHTLRNKSKWIKFLLKLKVSKSIIQLVPTVVSNERLALISHCLICRFNNLIIQIKKALNCV